MMMANAGRPKQLLQIATKVSFSFSFNHLRIQQQPQRVHKTFASEKYFKLMQYTST